MASAIDLSSSEFVLTLEALNNELFLLKNDQDALKSQISSFYHENLKLARDLKNNVYEQLVKLSDSDTVLLQQKYEAAVAAKNAAVEMWQAALEQIKNQEDLLMGKKSLVAIERSEIEQQFLSMKNDYIKAMNLLSDELSITKKDLSRTKAVLNEANTKLDSCTLRFEAACKELDQSKREVCDLTQAKVQLQDQKKTLTNLLENANKTLDAFTNELTALKKENSCNTSEISSLKDQNKKLRTRILTLEKDAKDSLITAQDAVLEKKEVLCKQEQYLKEIDMLKSSIELQMQKVSMRYKTQIKEMQNKASEKIQSLMASIEQLHQELADKQSLFERASREKQALESKLEFLSNENSKSAPISNTSFDELCMKLTLTERSRNEWELQVLSLERKLKELESAKEQEIQFLLEKQLSLKERNQSLVDDLNQASADRLKFADEVTRLKRSCYSLEQELKNLRNKHSEDISILQMESSTKVKALVEKQQKDEEQYKQFCSELQDLLQAEFRISGKWKSEVEELIILSESKITELCEEIAKLKHNNSELIKLLHFNNVNLPRQSLYLLNSIDSLA